MIEALFPGEHVDAMLRRLQRELDRNDTAFLLRRAAYFTPKGEERRKKSCRARNRTTLKISKPHGYGGW